MNTRMPNTLFKQNMDEGKLSTSKLLFYNFASATTKKVSILQIEVLFDILFDVRVGVIYMYMS